MNISNSNPMSFKATAIIKGSPNQHNKIHQRIQEEFYPEGFRNEGIVPYSRMTHKEGALNIRSSVLYATQENALKLQLLKLKLIPSTIMEALKKLNIPVSSGIYRMFNSIECGNIGKSPIPKDIKQFYNAHIKEYVQLPEKTLSARKVLHAMDQGNFDFIHLRIIK